MATLKPTGMKLQCRRMLSLSGWPLTIPQTRNPKKYDYDPHLAFLTSTNSLPFKLGKEKRIAVKVIDHRGNEVMVVKERK